MELKDLIGQLNTDLVAFKRDHVQELKAQKQRVDELYAKMNRPGVAMPAGSAIEDADHRKAFERFVRTGDAYALREKAMSIGTDADGGFTVPTELAGEIAKVALLYSPMRQLADVKKVGRADYAQIVSTNAAGGEWVGESDTRNDTSTPTLAEVRPPSGELSAVAPIRQWLLNDSEYDIAQFIVSEIGKSHGVSEGAAFLTGTGTNRPKGILDYTFVATADATRTFGQLEKLHSGAAGSFDADDLIDLLYKLKPEYRGNASWLMNPTTLATIRKMKSTSGDYIWQAAASTGQPSTLFGAPVFEDPNMPVVGAAANAVLVGDFKAGYQIIDIGSPVLIRDEVTLKGSVKFYVAKRVGGAVIDSNAIKALTLSV